MLDSKKIEECTADEFFGIYENVKSLIEDQSKLEELVKAVNKKIKTFPEGFRPEYLSLVKAQKEQEFKTYRISDDQKASLVHNFIRAMIDKDPDLSPKTKNEQKTFTFSDVQKVFEKYIEMKNDKMGTKFKASKTQISTGLSILHKKNLIDKFTPGLDENKPKWAKTTYKVLKAFENSRTKMKVEVDEIDQAEAEKIMEMVLEREAEVS